MDVRTSGLLHWTPWTLGAAKLGNGGNASQKERSPQEARHSETWSSGFHCVGYPVGSLQLEPLFNPSETWCTQCHPVCSLGGSTCRNCLCVLGWTYSAEMQLLVIFAILDFQKGKKPKLELQYAPCFCLSLKSLGNTYIDDAIYWCKKCLANMYYHSFKNDIDINDVKFLQSFFTIISILNTSLKLHLHNINIIWKWQIDQVHWSLLD